jgi:LysM repeat protein
MKKTIVFFCLLIAMTANAQKERGEAYVNTYKEIAIQEMLRTGVPAAITLAQGILESQFGESDLVKASNNHFGIKCKTEWTGPKTYHDDDEKQECFRVYPTAADSYKDHSDFLKTRPNYAFLFTLDPTDYEGWAKGLKKAGYATSPVYPQKLLKVINDYNLQQYSLQALARLKNTVPVEAPNTESSIKSESERLVTGAQPAVMIEKKAVSYPAGIFAINHTKVIYAKEGTSLLSLANQYDIPLSKLIEFNDLAEMDVLDADRLMFIEKKSKKGSVDFHMVAMGETLYDIAQQEGIRMESLLEYNHLSKSAQVSTGDRIFLRAVTLLQPGKLPK